jgi:hypothetical protein
MGHFQASTWLCYRDWYCFLSAYHKGYTLLRFFSIHTNIDLCMTNWKFLEILKFVNCLHSWQPSKGFMRCRFPLVIVVIVMRHLWNRKLSFTASTHFRSVVRKDIITASNNKTTLKQMTDHKRNEVSTEELGIKGNITKITRI